MCSACQPPTRSSAKPFRTTASSRNSAAAVWASSTKLRSEAHRFVALKFLPDEVARDPQALEPLSSAKPRPPPPESSQHLHIYEIGDRTGSRSSPWNFWRADAEASHRGQTPRNGLILSRGHRDCRRTGRRARQRHRPPRHQAREHLRHQARPRQDSGFRPGEAASKAGTDARCDADAGGAAY